MKRAIASILSSAILSFCTVLADDPGISNYIVMPDGTAMLGSGSFRRTAINRDFTVDYTYYVPSNVNGLVVSGITDDGYRWCTNLCYVILPRNDEFTKVGDRAFEGCRNIVRVDGLDRLEECGVGAFVGCTSLAYVDATGLYSVPDDAFIGCTSIRQVTTEYPPAGFFSDGRVVLSTSQEVDIGKSAFQGCTRLNVAKLSVTEIDDGAFFGCTTLYSVDFGSSCDRIGNRAFCGCTALSSISIPGSVSEIGEGAFYQCDNLTVISLPMTKRPMMNMFSSFQKVTEVYICANDDRTISEYAFANCKNAKSITMTPHQDHIPTNICGYAFLGCAELGSLTNLDQVVEIGPHAFHGCSKIANIAGLSLATSIGDGAFEGCPNLSGVTLHASQTGDDNLKRIGLKKSQVAGL